MGEPFLPYGRQEISDADIEAVATALRDPFITQGPRIAEFEEAIAGYVGARHAVAFSSGTAALHGAAAAAGFGPGDRVAAPALTFAASTNCVLYQRARPEFVDIDAATWNADIDEVARRLDESAAGAVVVSFAGLPIDVGRLTGRGGVVIEDACHAIGGERGGTKVGGPGGADMTVFSFHPVKTMTTGEGGLVTTEDETLAERLRAFRTHGIVKDDAGRGPTDGGWYYEMRSLGFNYRITDFQCALGLSQLPRLEAWVARRNEIASRYRDLLAGEDRIALPPAAPEGDVHAYHLFPVRVLAGAEARLVTFDALRRDGIGVQVHYIPVYRLPYYRDDLGYPQDACPETERYYSGAVSLPVFPAMRDDDVDRVVTSLRSALP